MLTRGDDVIEVMADGSGGIRVLDGGVQRIEVIDLSNATKGTREYDLLNNPLPNTRYELDNGTTFVTNSDGYVDEITFSPELSTGVRDGRTTTVGKEGLNGDVGGHIQACRLGGSCDRFNLFPQNANFNNSSYKRWENEIAGALQNGDDVGAITVRFTRSNPGSARPDALTIQYTVNGETIYKDFINQAGG